MTKVTLNSVDPSGSNTSNAAAINTNSQVIEDAFDNTLSLDGTQPNTMKSTLDMDSNRVINLPAPVGVSEPLRLQDITSINGNITINAIPAGGTGGQNLQKIDSTDYNVHWGNSANSVGLSLPADFIVSNSPVTNTGTLTGAWAVTPTGTGAVVRQTSPTLTTPTLNTPTLTSAVLGTPTSGTLTNCTLPVTGITGAAAGVTTWMANPTSTNMANITTDETGTGSLVFATNPVLVTPNLGTPSALVATNVTALNATQLTTGTIPSGRYSSSTAIRSALGVSGAPLGFRATKGGTDQTGIASASFTAVTFGTEDFDQGSYFTANAWTPPAGLISVQGMITSNAVNQPAGLLSIASVFKNGARFKDFFGGPVQTGSPYSLVVAFTDVAAGTDTYSISVFLTTSTSTATILGATNATWFSGIVYPA